MVPEYAAPRSQAGAFEALDTFVKASWSWGGSGAHAGLGRLPGADCGTMGAMTAEHSSTHLRPDARLVALHAERGDPHARLAGALAALEGADWGLTLAGEAALARQLAALLGQGVLRVDERLDGLRAALDAGQVQRFAIANPEHAPYGRAAEQALRGLGLGGVGRTSEGVSALLGGVPAERVAETVVAAGVRLRGLVVSRPDLEDLFVSLTGEGFDVLR